VKKTAHLSQHVNRNCAVPSHYAFLLISAKIAHAHMSFGRLIAEASPHVVPDKDGVSMHGTSRAGNPKRHFSCLNICSDECVVVRCLRPWEGLCRIKRRIKLHSG
jgi:hypothetical protein